MTVHWEELHRTIENLTSFRFGYGEPTLHGMLWMLADGLQPAAIELLLGLRFIKAMLYDTKPLDPKVFVAVAALLIASAALACTVPRGGRLVSTRCRS